MNSLGGVDKLLVTDEGFGLAEGLDPDRTYDVVLNEQAVWSFRPATVQPTPHDPPLVAWPEALHRFLRGHADVALVDHAEGTTVASAHHVFGGEDERTVSVRDSNGHPMVLGKSLRLTRPLDAADEATNAALMDELERLLTVLRDDAGVPAFICYGTLLGAVRDGRFIGHDNDMDIAYLSRHSAPVDVVREGFRIERLLRRHGWVVRRGSGVRLNVRLHMDDGTLQFIDVFTACWIEDVLYMQSDTGFELPRRTLLPLRTVSLMGRDMPAPADPETLLAATYGPGWREPDPGFRYQTPVWLSRRLQGWFGGTAGHRNSWDTFYTNGRRSELPFSPSPFATWVTQHYPAERPIIDLGTGNGRDAAFFARQGRPVRAVDYSMGIVTRARRRTSRNGLSINFDVFNLYDLRSALALGTRLSHEPDPVDLYARFVLHAVNPVGEENLLRLARMGLRRGGLLFLEFRTPDDRETRHHFGSKFRRYRALDDVVSQVERFGGRVLHRSEGRGLAPFADEDPHVARVVASWSQGSPS